MTSPLSSEVRPQASLVLVTLAGATLFVTGCSLDSKGFGGFDAGQGGSGTGGTAAAGGMPGGTGGVVGTGGLPAIGGMPGSGGAHPSGGAPGTGGHLGTGGATGGHVGSGGAAGGHVGSGGAAGGHIGSGGAAGAGAGPGGQTGTGGGGHEGPGTGGHGMGTGGKGGAGDTGGTGVAGAGGGGQGGQTCQQLVDDYAQAVKKARECTPGDADQCQYAVPATLSYCTTCPQAIVNDPTRLTAIRSQWSAQGCIVATICPAIACVVPPAHMCVPTEGGPMSPGGVCEATGVITN